MKTKFMGPLSLILSAGVYGSYGIIVRALAEELPHNSQILFRYFLALILVVALMMGVKAKIKLPMKQLSLLALFGLCMHLSIWFFTKSAFLISIPSLLGYLYIGSIVSSTFQEAFVFRGKVSAKSWVGVIIAIAGLSILIGHQVPGIGAAYALLAGCIESFTYSIRKKITSASKGLLTLTAIIGVLLFTTLTLIVTHETLIIPRHPATWFIGVLFAILITIVNIAMTYGFRVTPVNLGSVIMSGEIVFGSIFGYIFLRSVPTTQELLASILIILSIAWQNIRISRNNQIIAGVRNILEN